MRLFKKIISLGLAGAMFLSAGAGCFAADSGKSSPSKESEKKQVFSYQTSTLTEKDKINPYEFFDIDLTLPNYLGTITQNIKTSEGTGDVDVKVVYVPSDKWDGENYYSGISAEIKSDMNIHFLTCVDMLIGWREFYSYGFLSIDGGTYVFDGETVQMHFLNGPGLYTGLATIPFTFDETDIKSYDEAVEKMNPDALLMTAAGYQYVLLLDDVTIDYYMENGVLDENSRCTWDELRSLIESKRTVVSLPDDDEGLKNFKAQNAYVPGLFTDVSDERDCWYAPYVSRVFELGLMKGKSGGRFDPSGSLTIAEVLAMAARLNDIYSGGSGEFVQGDVWYRVYVNYCLKKGIIRPADFGDYTAAATRAQMAYIFARAIPEEALKQVNEIDTIPDVSSATPYDDEIFRLYRAGVLTGGTDGSFRPFATISRAEAAAIISRIAVKNMRIAK